MALPSLTKTWEGRINQTIVAQGTALACNKRIVRTIKDSLILTTNWVDASNGATTPSNMWAVRYSCNSSVAGSAGDGVDRWSADSDLVWQSAGAAHSWMVLRETAIDTNTELLIECADNSSNGALLRLVLSPSAEFTGGTTTARPTATDEIVALNGATWGGAGSADGNTVLHVQKSTDGQQWRVFVFKGGVCLTTWRIGKLTASHASLTHPAYIYAAGSGSADTNSQALMTAASGWNLRGVSNATAGLSVPCVAGTRITATETYANDLSSGWDIVTPGPLMSVTASNRGCHGHVPDLTSVSEARIPGDEFPGSGSTGQFAITGTGTLDPWYQTTMTVA
jgi:hypothetical protein